MSSKGINKMILLGNLGKDPEVRYAASGAAVATLSLATSRSWKDKQSGELQNKTEWHRVKAFGRQAEIIGENARKGSQLYIEGRLETNKWQDNSGQDRYTTEIVVVEFQFIGSRSRNSDQAQSQNQPQQRQQPQQESSPEAAQPNAGFGTPGGFDTGTMTFPS